MQTTIGSSSDLRPALCALIELEYDAMSAYRAAILRTRDLQTRRMLEGFQADHLRHARELGRLLRERGAEPPDGGDIHQVLPVGRVVIGNLAGDRGVLTAMRSDENDTNLAYENVLRRPDLSPAERAVLERALDDERRHLSWIAVQLSGS